jgi:hypothetical protein
MHPMILLLILVVGAILAFPLAVAICTFLGAILWAYEWLTIRCPSCQGRRCMQHKNGIKETFPTGRGTGRFYLCRSCGQRSFWSNDDKGWQDATDAKYDWAYEWPFD